MVSWNILIHKARTNERVINTNTDKGLLPLPVTMRMSRTFEKRVHTDTARCCHTNPLPLFAWPAERGESASPKNSSTPPMGCKGLVYPFFNCNPFMEGQLSQQRVQRCVGRGDSDSNKKRAQRVEGRVASHFSFYRLYFTSL